MKTRVKSHTRKRRGKRTRVRSHMRKVKPKKNYKAVPVLAMFIDEIIIIASSLSKGKRKKTKNPLLLGSEPVRILHWPTKEYVEFQGEPLKLEYETQAQKIIDTKLGGSRAFKVVRLKK